MFINPLLEHVQNSKVSSKLADSFILKNADNLSFVLLITTIIFTSFAPSGIIGASAILFVLSCVFKAFFKKGETAELSFINKILIIYLLIVIISTFGASYFMLSLKGILKTFIYISFYFASIYFLSCNKKKIIPVVLTIAAVVSTEGIIGILQNLSHVEAIATWQDTSNVSDASKIISRAYGTLKPYNPNLLAGYLVAGLSSILFFTGYSFLNKNKPVLIGSSILFLLSSYAIFITGSRGAYLGLFGFVLCALLMGFFYIKKFLGGFGFIKKKYKILTASIVCLGISFLLFVPSILNRIISIFSFRKDSSISFRLNVYEACYQMFLDNKFLGIGVGNNNFREIYGLYMKTGYDALGSYCVPLEIAVESGIFALLTFVFFITLIILRSIKFIFKENIKPEYKMLIMMVLLTIISVMFHGFFDTVFFRPQIQILFWTNIAVFHAITIDREELKKHRLKS